MIPATYSQAEAIADCKAQLAQIETRIASALADRATVRGQRAWCEINNQLHGLYVLQYDVQKDLERCEAGDYLPA